jgi:asparagine synthase (glutamine-hydrolysing)
MCGIGGILGAPDEGALGALAAALAHRGPDDHGLHTDAARGVAFAHRRLSIIDLSPAGRQPMSFAGGRFWITYNGEIYNYRSLREELEKQGHAFRTHTDTEVLLAAYAEWGEGCLARLRGMFAFALWDREAGSVLLARDRFGIKPLYYAAGPRRLVFASELKALLASGLVARRADAQALWDYLSLGCVPPPRTLLAEVRALPPGHALCADARGGIRRLWRWWDVAESSAQSFPQAARLPRAEAALELRRLLDEATRLHLIADVPVGAFLSGGVDSTAVVGLMSRQVRAPIKTYSIGFEAEHGELSELPWARLAARRFGTEHSEVVLTGAAVAEHYDELVWALDQPSIDGTNTWFVSRATRAGVTVALSGLGGDELFAGYSHFRRLARAARFDGLRDRAGAWGERWPLRLARKGGLGSLAFALAGEGERQARIREQLSERAKRRLAGEALRAHAPFEPLAATFARWIRPQLDPVARTSCVEIEGWLASTLLRDADATSMAHALELRPVLLDHVLAEFAFALPAHYKLEAGRSKAILLDALGDLLPPEIAARPKMGFALPLRAWLAGALRERALAALESESARALFAAGYRRRRQVALRGGGRVPQRAWAELMLVSWLERHACRL